MENVSTVVICLVLVVICLLSFISYKKKLKSGCCGAGDTEVRVKSDNTDKSHYAHKITVFIDGMTCAHCKMRIENAFNRKEGCLAKVNLRKKYAEVWTEKPISDDELRKTIESNGYTFVKCITEK